MRFNTELVDERPIIDPYGGIFGPLAATATPPRWDEIDDPTFRPQPPLRALPLGEAGFPIVPIPALPAAPAFTYKGELPF